MSMYNPFGKDAIVQKHMHQAMVNDAKKDNKSIDMTGSTIVIDFPSSRNTNSIDDHDDVDNVGMIIRDRDDEFDKLENLNMDLKKKRKSIHDLIDNKRAAF